MERTNLKEVMLEASRCGLVVFRNNTGMIRGDDGRMHRFGLCVGSSDLIGWRKSDGKFVAIEVKAARGKVSDAQVNFLTRVKEAGGIAILSTDPKKLKEQLDEFL